MKKKKQKTFASLGRAYCRTQSHVEKVFWFFFQKRTCLPSRARISILKLDVLVNGQRVNALLDTGALMTTLTLDAATRAGVTRDTLSSQRIVIGRGADGSDMVAYRAHVHDMALGTLHVADFPVLVWHLRIPFTDMMLGVDFL